jgi:hypothetical protein
MISVSIKTINLSIDHEAICWRFELSNKVVVSPIFFHKKKKKKRLREKNQQGKKLRTCNTKWIEKKRAIYKIFK